MDLSGLGAGDSMLESAAPSIIFHLPRNHPGRLQRALQHPVGCPFLQVIPSFEAERVS